MHPKKFDYIAPGSLQEAVQVLKENEDAKVLAGGQSLLALMKLGLAAPAALVDINGLRDRLAYVKEDKKYLAVGALTLHDAIEHDETIEKRFTLLNDAARRIGDQQIRNRGTIGGSCCHADPASDLPTALIALDPEFVAFGSGGERVMPHSEFFLDTFTTSLKKDEILSEIRLPYLPPHSSSAYTKYSRREGDFALVGVGVALTLGAKNTCEDVRISLGAVGPTPTRAKSAEEYLKGKSLTDANMAEAGEKASEAADPPSDMHGSQEYRRDMVKVFVRRTLKLAQSRAGQ